MSDQTDNSFKCPKCSEPLNDHTCLDGPQRSIPRDGDFAICGECACFMRFDEKKGGFREVTPEDCHDLTLKQIPAVMRIIEKIKADKGIRRKKDEWVEEY